MRAAVLIGLLCAAPPAFAAPAGTMNEMWDQFRSCLVVDARGAEKAPVWAQSGEVTVRFSLRRDGSLIGRPHITFFRLPPGEAEKRVILDAFAVALNRCLPLQITESLGGAIAGRPLALRMKFGERDQGI